MLGARSPEAWPRADCATMLPRIARGVEQTGVEPTRLIVHTADRTLIGETGFHGAPDGSGTVEVLYSIASRATGGGDSLPRRCEPSSSVLSNDPAYAGSRPSARLQLRLGEGFGENGNATREYRRGDAALRAAQGMRFCSTAQWFRLRLWNVVVLRE
jgi:hypothetical protein